MGAQLIEHNGKQVLYVDYRGLTRSEEQFQCLNELGRFLRQSSQELLIFSNYEGVQVFPEFLGRVRSSGKELRAKIGRQAIVGITGVKVTLLKGYITFTGQRNIRTFENEQEALDWLTS